MDAIQLGLTLKRPIVIKVIVTPRWKEEVQQQLQGQVGQLDGQLQQLDQQAQKIVEDIKKQTITPIPPQVAQQIDNIQIQANQKKAQILEQKNQILQQLQQVQMLEMGQEAVQAQMEGYCSVAVGDNLIKKLNVQVVMRDGIVEEIRGEL
jgi:F0F1-type ATP synthase membrane subunit b/b'